MKTRLHVDAMRIVGPPDMRVTRVALLPGAWGFAEHRKVLQRQDVEAVVIGEAQEWETIEYVVDAIAAGIHQGPHRAWPRAVRATGHGDVRRVAEDDSSARCRSGSWRRVSRSLPSGDRRAAGHPPAVRVPPVEWVPAAPAVDRAPRGDERMVRRCRVHDAHELHANRLLEHRSALGDAEHLDAARSIFLIARRGRR